MISRFSKTVDLEQMVPYYRWSKTSDAVGFLSPIRRARSPGLIECPPKIEGPRSPRQTCQLQGPSYRCSEGSQVMNSCKVAPTLQPPPLATRLSDMTTTTTTTTTTSSTARTGDSSSDSLIPDFQNTWAPSTPPSVSISTASATGSVSPSIFSSRSSDNNPTKDDPNCPSSPFFSPRVVYGAGTIARLPSELGRLHLSTPLIVSSPSCISLARRIQTLIPNLDSRILDSALVSVPQRVVDEAVSRITDRDCVISIGGTSAMGLAKTIAGIKEIPHVCIPTTYSGSETVQFASDSSRKRSAAARRRSAGKNGTGRIKSPRHRSVSTSDCSSSSSSSSRKSADVHSKNLPSIIIYDEDLTATMCANEVVESRVRRSSNEDAQWSYIHLPGV